MVLDRVPYHAHHHQHCADETVCHGRLVGNEGCGDQQQYRQKEQDGGNLILHNRAAAGLDTPVLLTEQPQQDHGGDQSADLRDEEHAGAAQENEKVVEAQTGVAAQQDGRGIAHQRGGALQVAGYGDGDDHPHGADIQSLCRSQRHRSDHKNGRYIVHERRDQTSEKAEDDDGPLDAGNFLQDKVAEQGRHSGVDDKSNQTHGARDHEQNVEIDAGQDLVQREHSCDNEDHGGGNGHIRSVLRKDDHQYVGENEKDYGKQHGQQPLSFRQSQTDSGHRAAVREIKH